MLMSVEALQQQIIHKIMNLDVTQLQEIDATLESYVPTNAVIDALHTPMRDKLNIEQLGCISKCRIIKSINYKNIYAALF